MRPQGQYFGYRVIAFDDQTIAQMLKFVKQHHLLIMAVLQLVQRLANRFNVALAQHFSDKLQLAAASFHFDTLGQFNGVAQIGVQRDLIQRVFPQIHQFRAQAF